jgi:hypothetical protein
VERHLLKHAKIDDPVTFQLLRTTPGIGPILGLILLYVKLFGAVRLTGRTP